MSLNTQKQFAPVAAVWGMAGVAGGASRMVLYFKVTVRSIVRIYDQCIRASWCPLMLLGLYAAHADVVTHAGDRPQTRAAHRLCYMGWYIKGGCN